MKEIELGINESLEIKTKYGVISISTVYKARNGDEGVIRIATFSEPIAIYPVALNMIELKLKK